MSSDHRAGHSGGFFVFGEVVNRKDDPTQTGMCKVKWNTGGISQSDLNESDLPWSKPMFPSGNPSIKGKGGPHTGFLEGTKVYGFSPSGDGQDIIIMGSVLSAGSGERDQEAKYDSEIPPPAKDQSVGGQSQSGKYDDKNGVVTDDSIVNFAQDEGGGEKKRAQYADLPDPIGMMETIPA